MTPFVEPVNGLIFIFCNYFSTLLHCELQKKYGWFFLSQCFLLLAAWVYGFFTTAFLNTPSDNQWVLGLISPLVREFFVWMLIKIVFKALGEHNNTSAKLSCIHYMESRHSLFLAIMMGSVATPATTYIIVGMDFVINIFSGLKIVYKLRYSKEENAKENGSYQF